MNGEYIINHNNLKYFATLYSLRYCTLYHRSSSGKDKILNKLKGLKQKIKQGLSGGNENTDRQTIENTDNKPIIEVERSKNYFNKMRDYYQVKKNQLSKRKEELVEKISQKSKKFKNLKNNQVLVKKGTKFVLFTMFVWLNVYMFLMKFYYRRSRVRVIRFCFYSGLLFVGLNWYLQKKINDYFESRIREILESSTS
jgi:hypothetical protein